MKIPIFTKRRYDLDEAEGTAIGALWQQMEKHGTFTTEEIIHEPVTYACLVVCYGYKCKKGETSLSESDFNKFGIKLIKHKLPNDIQFQIEDEIKVLGDELLKQYRIAVCQLKEENEQVEVN